VTPYLDVFTGVNFGRFPQGEEFARRHGCLPMHNNQFVLEETS